jgi:hypothetical protein
VDVDVSGEWNKSWSEVYPKLACFLSTSVKTTGAILHELFRAAYSVDLSLATFETVAASLDELIKVMMLE